MQIPKYQKVLSVNEQDLKDLEVLTEKGWKIIEIFRLGILSAKRNNKNIVFKNRKTKYNEPKTMKEALYGGYKDKSNE